MKLIEILILYPKFAALKKSSWHLYKFPDVLGKTEFPDLTDAMQLSHIIGLGLLYQ